MHGQHYLLPRNQKKKKNGDQREAMAQRAEAFTARSPCHTWLTPCCLCCMSPWLVCFLSAAPCAMREGGAAQTAEISGFRMDIVASMLFFKKGSCDKVRAG